MSGDLFRQHWGAILGALVAVTCLGTCMYAIVVRTASGVARRARRPEALGQSGAVFAEFLIVVIPFFMMVTGLIQLSLAAMARLMVSYSAFCAARAAAVFVPLEPKDVPTIKEKLLQAFTEEGQNKIGYGTNTRIDFAISKKAALIRNAASFALIPASPGIASFYSDVTQNWKSYFAARLQQGLDPRAYLGGLIGDLGSLPAGMVDALGNQLRSAIQHGLETPAAKAAAKRSIESTIDSSISDPTARSQAKQVIGNFIDNYVNPGSAESPAGSLGTAIQDGMNGILSGPLDRFRDLVQGSVNNALADLPKPPPGVGGDSGFVGASVDRALDSGVGDSTGGASGALLRTMSKLIYAHLATIVTLRDDQGKIKSRFAWNDPVTARVTYLFYCQIPLANRFAGMPFYKLPDDLVQDLATGPLKGVSILGLPGFFLPISAEHTFALQGRPND